MKGKLTVIGIGPGKREYMTTSALEAIKDSEIIVGYKTYIDMVEDLIVGKTVISNGMMQEVERCEAAVEKARNGFSVSVICGGDAGVYGLAGLVLELLDHDERETVQVIPGVTSATACASLLGAPLIHDFAVISLSNLMTETDLIRKRLKLAAEGDFVTVIYNPKSIKRKELFYETAQIFLKFQSPDTPVGIVKDAYRESQIVKVTTLENLKSEEWVDMRTTLIIGNSQTIQSGNKMITPRGYRI
ncbi:MAG: precorrin-3B C(17)-methyltransferase [Spirochaetaceae bacterium]|jgi:precorrin-3B C17-methyltransferase|nr:precorrin-3B C(17)-methyltransferase [Spirochaetaceae bacterium]